MNITRRNFFIGSAAVVAAASLKAAAPNPVGKIQGFDESSESKTDGPWEPFSDKKVRMGIAGYGVCTFGAVFSFQDHPNVEVVAATDLDPERCKKLAHGPAAAVLPHAFQRVLHVRHARALHGSDVRGHA